MNTFPPIADYAFLSDCEVSALVRARRLGRVVVPPPARFAERLRRAARPLRRQFFRFGPCRTARRVPTSAGTCPARRARDHVAHPDGMDDGGGPARRRPGRGRRTARAASGCPATRSATGHAAPHRDLLCSGRVEVQIDCLPLFDYGRQSGRVELRRHAATTVPNLTARRPVPRPHLASSVSARHRRPCRVRAHHVARGRIGVRGALVGRRRLRRPWKRPEPTRKHAELLARLAEHARSSRPPLAAVHRAQRARAQGPELRADRRDHGRDAPRRFPRRPAASATGTTATRGSATPPSCCGRSTTRLRLGGVRVLRLHPRRVRGPGRQPRRQRRDV